jgi:hypothetical protein
MDRRIDIPKDETFGRDRKPGPPRYFLPGQIILQVEHPEEVTSDELVTAVTEFLYDNKEGQEWRDRIEPPQQQSVIPFPRREDKDFALSLIPTQLPNGEASDKKLIKLYNDLNSRLQDSPLNIRGDINLRATPLNWLVGGAHGQSGTGGPGGWPLEAHIPLGDSSKFQLVNKQGIASQLSSVNEKGNGVHVAILDTAPSQHALDRAYSEWHWHHPLVESMLRPNGPLRVYSASYADLHQMDDYDLLRHRYLMRDHGLFIAGIIHTIAPEATLHLYEVLNPYGVGCLETIARGLQKVLQNPEIEEGNPLIINCSFMLGIPTKSGDSYDWKKFYWDFPQEFQNLETLQQMSIATQEIFDNVAGRKNTTIVAAAGNDALDDIRPDARYPAAFDTVLGVGALPNDPVRVDGKFKAATYSNLSDMPVPDGYITLGGEPGPAKGVRGVYIGEFPDYEAWGFLEFLRRILPFLRKLGHLPKKVRLERIKYKRNLTGWAWWAGTSFATPVISGILAARNNQQGVLGTPNSPHVQGILGSLIQNDETDKHEKVISVRQG